MAPASSQNAASSIRSGRLSPASPIGMLGSVSDAEDVIQDAFLRWLDVDRDAVHACTDLAPVRR